jgi:hypothetical protein
MEIKKEEELAKQLVIFNPWWKDSKIPDVPEFKRLDFGPLSGKLEDEEVLAIIGARQVGKTTLMKQLIEFLLENGTKPNHILYVWGDSIDLNLISSRPIQDSLDVYQNYFLKKTFSDNHEKIYIFIDEVQKISNWSGILKNYVDLNKNLKFVVSGSSSTKIFQNGVESLVGRFQRQIVVPFKFLEAVRFKYFIEKKDSSQLESAKTRLRKKFSEAVKAKNASIFYDEALKVRKDLLQIEAELRIILNEYLVKGGYPKIITTDDQKRCMEILNMNIENILKIDIRDTFSINDTLTLQKMMKLISRHTSEKANIETLSRVLDKKRDTIERYLSHLEDAYIICISSFYAGVKATKKSKKIYVNDIGLRNSINNSFDSIAVQEDIGRVVETVAFNHCIRFCFNLNPSMKPTLFYWQDKMGNEVDVILECSKKPIPIEIKYTTKIHGGELKGIKNFIKEKTPPFGICVTNDIMNMNEKIVFIPLWLFLIMC